MIPLGTHRRITGPLAEPVSLTDAREQLRLDDTADDVLLAGLITVARQHLEAVTGRALVTQTWEQRLADFPQAVELVRAPVQSVMSITYVDASGATQTLPPAVYQLVRGEGADHEQRSRLIEAFGQVWPGTRGHSEDVAVRYVAGYGNPSAVPTALRHAMLLAVGHLWENREASAPTALATIPLGFSALVAPFTLY